MRLLTLLLLGLLAAPARAETPVLNGGLISATSTGLARYNAGQTAHISVTLTNNTGGSFTGTLTGTLTGRGVATGTNVSIPVTSLSISATQTYDLAFVPTAAADYRGYFVQIQAINAGSTVIDSASASFSVEGTPYVYPRYCFASQFTAATTPALNVAALNAWKCSGLQFYDVTHRQATPYVGGASWTNLSNTVISAATLEQYIALATRLGMFTFLFNDMATSDSTVTASGEAVPLTWALFTVSSPQTAATTANYPAAGGTSCYGATGTFPVSWQSPYIINMDPTNTAWQAYTAAQDLQFVRAYGMTGINLDTLGDPSCSLFKTGGSAVSYTSALGGIYAAVRAATGVPMVIQDELQLHLFNVLAQSPTFYLSELHPNFAAPATFKTIATSIDNIRIINAASPPVYMVYSEETYAQTNTSCTTDGGSSICNFSNPGVLYKDDMLLAAGAWPMDVTDGSDGGVHIVSNIYVPNTAGQLAINPALLTAQQDRRNFGVAYEKLLRGGVLFDATHTTTCTGVATCATTGAAGSVYLIPVARAGLQMLQMLNYQQLASIADASDTSGTASAPNLVSSIPMKMYYGGAVTGSNKLWFASPDVNHGAPQSIAFSKSSDGGGNFITFTVPSLLYWDMLWLELDALSGSDYATP